MRYLLIYLLLIPLLGQSQFENRPGYSGYQKQDKSFITTDLRGKHSFSFGFDVGHNSPFTDEVFFNYGFHFGYNYLILDNYVKTKRKRSGKTKTKTKPYFQKYLGLHLDIYNYKEFVLNVKYFAPFITLKGFMFKWNWFSEIGFGVHQLPKYFEDENLLKANLSLEIFRIKFLKAPLFFHTNMNYNIRNNLSSTEKQDIQFLGGFRYYFYKNKV
ncbi:MAG: hypothetical protein ACWA41_02970 [Putridiphycobacter sp.]